MAVASLQSSASAGNGGMYLFSNSHEHDRCQTGDRCQTVEEFRNEIDRVLGILLYTVKNASSTPDVDAQRNDRGDVPVMVCDGEGDGGHRCPYFPCPNCHRSRSIFVPESKTALMISAHDDSFLTCDGEGDGGHRCPYFPCPDCHRSRSIFVPKSKTTLMICPEEDVTCDDEGDGGHRCPYFPCPDCHRNRSIFVPKPDLQTSLSHAHVHF